ncbi:hypothetical protein CISIN_1g048308mg [Citrus sinensis]|uniref:AAA+ ATPase domain-containing protein n=1 Tax=Citrus sinensis TaxID=2711 RepID=A0A067GK88_CITSI|nr:hypothetical protein CISIN_1g048308mg [Citrus sinensis]
MILKGIRGVSSLGELLAILGPSGRGKTTLPTTLGGRLSTGETRGNIDYNNNPLSRTVKRKTGFVAHSNVFYLHLTVTETLVFIALFRLPIKRVSRAQELLINPSLLFLDEPASGLDSTIAKQILLNSEGNSLHVGKGDGVMSYFVGIGFEPSAAMNPSDFLLDLANGVVSGDPKDDQKALKETLISAYKSNLSEKLKASFQEVGDHSLIGPGNKKNSNWSTTWWQQSSELLKRNFRQSSSFCGSKLLSQLTSHRIHIINSHICYCFNFRLSSYFVAKTIGDLPMELTLPTVFVVVTYWMARIKSTTPWLIKPQSIRLAIGAVLMKQKVASTITATIVLQYLLQRLPVFTSWFEYASLTYYSYRLLLPSQYKANDTCYAGLSHQIICVAALAVMLLGSRLAAYDALMGIGRISH